MKFIMRQCREALGCLREIRGFVVIAGMVFIVAAILGYGVSQVFPGFFGEMFELVAEILRSGGIIDDEGGISAVGLFINNSRVAFFAIVQGAVPFVFLTAASVIINGTLIGIVLGVRSLGGVNPLLLFASGILPHGIFELSALFVSWGAGLYLCYAMIKLIFGHLDGNGFLALLKKTAALYCCIVLPLLAVAAAVEAYVTPWIMSAVL